MDCVVYPDVRDIGEIYELLIVRRVGVEFYSSLIRDSNAGFVFPLALDGDGEISQKRCNYLSVLLRAPTEKYCDTEQPGRVP